VNDNTKSRILALQWISTFDLDTAQMLVEVFPHNPAAMAFAEKVTPDELRLLATRFAALRKPRDQEEDLL
jgi:hypothetical protein